VVDGEYRWCLFRAVPVRDELGHLVNGMARRPTSRTASGPRRPCIGSEALLAGEKRVLEMIATGDATPPHPGGLMRVVEEQSSDMLSSWACCWMRTNHLRTAPHPAFRKGTSTPSTASPLAYPGGSCITAAYRAAPVVVSDIAVDPLWADYRHLPWRTACEPAGRADHVSEARCWAPSRCNIASPAAPSPHDLYVIDRSRLWQRFPSRISGRKRGSGNRKGSSRQIVEAIPQAHLRPGTGWELSVWNSLVLEYTGLTRTTCKRGTFVSVSFIRTMYKGCGIERQQGLARGVPFEMENAHAGKTAVSMVSHPSQPAAG